MKLKSLAVITLLVLGCASAFAGTYAFGFLDYTGGEEYCNYEYFITGGADNYYMSGYDVLDTCSAPYYPFGTIEGLGITVPGAALESNGLQKGITGKGHYFYADNIYDAYDGFFTGDQWAVVTATSTGPIKPKHWNWDGLAGFSGYEFLGNFGFLTTTIPDASRRHAGTTMKGTVAAAKSKTAKTTLQ